MLEIHAVCPKCGADYGKPADVKKPGNCGECQAERVQIVVLELKAVNKPEIRSV